MPIGSTYGEGVPLCRYGWTNKNPRFLEGFRWEILLEKGVFANPFLTYVRKAQVVISLRGSG